MAFKRCTCGRVAVVEIDGAPRCTDCSGMGMKESEVRDLAAQVCGFLSASPDLPDGVGKEMFLKAARVCRLLNDLSGQMQALQQLCSSKTDLLTERGCYDDALWSSLVHQRDQAHKERDAALAALDQERSEEPGTIRGRMKGLAKWAVEKLGHQPYLSHPFEMTIMEKYDAAVEEAGRLRALLGECRKWVAIDIGDGLADRIDSALKEPRHG